jgi:penicillin-binding protein 1A
MGKKRKFNAGTFIKNILKTAFMMVVIFGFLGVGIVGAVVYSFIQSADKINPEEFILKGFTTTVYDDKGKEITALRGEKNREMMSVKEMPDYLKYSFIAIEDKRFYEHRGVDLKRFTGAVINYIIPQGETYGGSTITQQVVKNITGDTEHSIKRKIQELYKAIDLENNMNKDDILQLYLNVIYMGHGAYGVQSAAKLYFDKEVDELSIAEAASLAGITNSPATYDLFTAKGKEANIKRQQIILSELKSLGQITEVQYNQARNEELKVADPKKTKKSFVSSQSYFVDQVVLDVKKDLMEKFNVTDDVALKMIYNNGYKIFTTMSSTIQSHMDKVFQDDSYFTKVNKTDQVPQAAMVIIDPKDGRIKGIYGGSGKKVGNTLNRATSSDIERQPGSTIKPIGVYGPAIDQGLITAGTAIDDAPVYMLGKDKGLYPKNYDHRYSGLMTIRTALKRSINVVAAKVWTINESFPSMALTYLSKAGIDIDETYVSVALGGPKKGVNTKQMAAAYVPFVNKGIYFKPTTYTKVLDSKGNQVLFNKPMSSILYNETTPIIMTSMMQEVVQPGGTAYPYGLVKEGKIPSAGKTGTTSDNYDKWFVGYTPYYVGAVWYGYDFPTTLVPGEYNRAQKLWSAVMESVHQNLRPKSFNTSDRIVKVDICGYSGQLPTELCYKDQRGSSVYTEIFSAGTEPTTKCEVHVSMKICDEGSEYEGYKVAPNQYCPENKISDKVFIKRPVPYERVSPEDPHPHDRIYELEYATQLPICPYHMAPPTLSRPSDRLKNLNETIRNRTNREN